MPQARVAVTVTPVLGDTGHGAQPLCSLLVVEDARILLDCGWSEDFDETKLEPLRDVIAGVDAILVSASSLECAGALPYVYTTLGCTAPCYMTLPVNRLAPLALLDVLAYKSGETSDKLPYKVEDVASAFELQERGQGGRAVQMRFGEDAVVKGLSISPVNAGHTVSACALPFLACALSPLPAPSLPRCAWLQLGACAWRIQRAAETIIYAPTFNHRSEAHLAKATLPALFHAPSVLITSSLPGQDLLQDSSSAGGAEGGGAAGKETSAVNKQLAEACISTLRTSGSVLLPVDTAGRCLEVLLRLASALSPDALRAVGTPPAHEPREGYPIYLLSAVSNAVLEHANTLLGFMNERCSKDFAESRQPPFLIERGAVVGKRAPLQGANKGEGAKAPVRVVQTVEPILETMRAGVPCVVLASSASLSCGHSRTLLKEWASTPNHTVIVTGRAGIGEETLAAQLLATPAPESVSLESSVTIPLTGAELKKWREGQDEEKRRTARAAAAARARAQEQAELAETVVVAAPVSGAMEVDAGGGTQDSVPVASPSLPAAAPSHASSGEHHAPSQAHSHMRRDADGYTLDEDMIPLCSYVDEVVEAGVTAALLSGKVGGKRRREATRHVLARGPATVRFAMYGRDLGSAASSVPTPYGWSVLAEDFSGEGGEGDVDLLSTGKGRGGRDRGGARGRSGDNKADATALAALERLLPLASPSGGGEGEGQGRQSGQGEGEGSTAAGPSTAAVLASVVAASGLLRPGESAPTKKVRTVVTLAIRARIRFIPLEGRVDGPSLVNTAEEMRPGRVVLLGQGGSSSRQGRQMLASALAKACSAGGVLCPLRGEAVDVSSGVTELTMPMRDSLWSTLAWAKMGGGQGGTLEVAYVRAAVEKSGGEESGAVLTLPATSSAGHLPVLLRAGGPARIADVRKRLAKAGVETEATGEGTLVTAGGIIISRAAASGGGPSLGPVFELEGPVCAEYYTVRKALYDLFLFV